MKKILYILLCLFPLSVSALTLPSTYSEKVLLYDVTDDQVLLEKNADEVANIASLTKIMTTITAIETIPDIKESITITSTMLAGIPYDASIAGLKVGEVYTVEDLLYASILPSGADATQALAVTSAGSISAFVDIMNELAFTIGVKNTHFVNVTGLDIDNHYSTAEDVLLILKYALTNPLFKEIYCTKEYTLTNGKTVNATIKMYNRLMNLDTSRILGSKTGYTSKSGVCIAALINSNGHEIIIITLGAPYVYGNFYNLQDALNLTDFIDANYHDQTLITTEEVVKELSINLATKDTYSIYPSESITKYLPDDYDTSLFTYQYEGVENISFMTKENTSLGTIKYYYNGALLKEEEVLLHEKLQLSWKKIFKKYKKLLLILILGIFLLLLGKKKKRARKKA